MAGPDFGDPKWLRLVQVGYKPNPYWPMDISNSMCHSMHDLANAKNYYNNKSCITVLCYISLRDSFNNIQMVCVINYSNGYK